VQTAVFRKNLLGRGNVPHMTCEHLNSSPSYGMLGPQTACGPNMFRFMDSFSDEPRGGRHWLPAD
jgi:hypothetical protein